MHIKAKYIDAVHEAIDFIETNIDGADDDKQEQKMLEGLRELRKSMQESKHKKLVRYYVRKNSR